MNQLAVQNDGESLICPFAEPYGEDFWMKSGDSFTVVPPDDGSDAQFMVVHSADRVTVWIFEGGDHKKIIVDYTVIDSNGTELECAHQHPAD